MMSKRKKLIIAFFSVLVIFLGGGYYIMQKPWAIAMVKTYQLPSEPKELLEISNNALEEGDLPTAILALQKALKKLESQEQPELKLEIINQLAEIYGSYLGDYETAINYYQQALNIAQETEDLNSESAILQKICSAYPALGEFDQGIDFCQQQLEIAKKLDSSSLIPIDTINALQTLAMLHLGAGNYDEAIEKVELVLELSENLKNIELDNTNSDPDTKKLKDKLSIYEKEIKKLSFAQLEMIYGLSGDYQTALEYNQKQLSLVQADDNKNQEEELQIFFNMANNYQGLGNYPTAIDYYNRSLTIAKNINNLFEESKILRSFGGLYTGLGDYKQGLNYVNQSLDKLQQFKQQQNLLSYQQKRTLKQLETNNLDHLAFLSLLKGEYDQAIDYAQQSFNLLQGDHSIYKVFSLSTLGSMYTAKGDYQKGIDLNKQALDILNSSDFEAFLLTKTPYMTMANAIILGSLAETYASLGETKIAVDYANQYFEMLDKNPSIDNTNIRQNGLTTLGRSLFLNQDFAQAETTMKEAVELLESMRAGLAQEDGLKISFFDLYSDAYDLLQQTLIAQNKTEEALEIAERGRARALVELLADHNPNSNIKLEYPTIDKIKQIAQQQNATLVEYSIVYDQSHPLLPSRLQETSLNQELELYIWVVQPNGKITFRRSNIKSLNYSIAQLQLQMQQAIGIRGENSDNFSFQIGDFVRLKQGATNWELWKDKPAFTIEKINDDGTIVITNPDSNYVETRQPEDLELTNNPQATSAKLQELYQLLIAPIEDLLPTNETDSIIFIPHQHLFYVPFVALQNPQGEYLIQNHTILTAPAIQVLDLIQQSPTQLLNQLSAVVVGNPQMPTIPLDPEPLPPLPFSQTEAQTVADFFNVDALTGISATKANVIPQMEQAGVIHLATHGLIDDVKKLGSPGAIALAPSAKDNDDGWLTSNDILELDLQAKLVVLSACNSGGGDITGDGVIGLSRSFLSAGADNLIVSLWAVEDEATSELMIKFYQNLATMKPPQALRQAMLTTMAKEQLPEKWAAFSLIGQN
jgi:CHAT domain-containing protein